jgi:NTP pyrophosphatase (non-canonical NTP hydrolase)
VQIRYKFFENGLPVYATRADIFKQIGDPHASAEEVERSIDEYLKSKDARRVFDGFLNEYQLDVRLTVFKRADRALDVVAQRLCEGAEGVARAMQTPEGRLALSQHLGEVLWAAACMADELGVSLSVVAERDLARRRGEGGHGV